MRILHTADWHLGRLFYNDHLTEEQSYVIEEQFFPLLKEEKIDAILLSGDIFDRSVPPIEALELWDSVLHRLAFREKIPLLAISGNHDSGPRISMAKGVWESYGIHLIGYSQGCVQPIPLEDNHGTIHVWTMPYGEPRDIHKALGTVSPSEDETILTLHDVYERWVQYSQHQSMGHRTIAMAHAFVLGGIESESERPLSIGGTSAIDASLFAPFSYTALGHLHRPQYVKEKRIRYSGSLLPYSFDEVGYRKNFTIIDMGQDGEVDVQTIPIESRKGMASITGYFDDIMEDEELHKRHQFDYVEVRLLDKTPIIDGMRRLKKVLPHCMRMELIGRMEVVQEESGVKRFKELSERDLFHQFAKEATGEALELKEIEYIDSLWNRIMKEEIS